LSVAVSLRFKWTAIIFAVALGPLAIATFAVDSIQRTGLASAERDLELAVLDSASREIAHTMRDVEDAVRRAGIALADARIQEDARLELARETITAADAVDWVSVFDREGSPIGAIEKQGGGKPATEIDRELLRETQSRWIGRRWLSPLVVDGAVTGWLLGGLRADAFQTKVTALSFDRLGRPDRVCVIDRSLDVVAGDPRAWPPGKALAATDLFRRVELGKTAFSKRLEVHSAFDAADGTPMTGTVRVLPEQQWAVVVVRPEAEAFVALVIARKTFAAIVLVIAALSLVAGAVFGRRITRPIERLAELTRAYARREFTKKSDVRSNDELGQLGSALGRMADDLAESEREIKRRAAIEGALSRYMPTEVASAIAEGDDANMLAGQRTEVSILFADVAAFTPFVERADPERVVALLNELFTVLSEVVLRQGGMVDKYIGDCVMAVFGLAKDGANHVEAALRTAEDMHRFVEASARRWREVYDVDVSLGIGIATGEALLGNLGSERRMEFTAIGDAVNVAARLETIARPAQTLVTGAVAARASDRFELRSLGRHPVRGKAEPVEILEVMP
jgi:adenylate cyclase